MTALPWQDPSPPLYATITNTVSNTGGLAYTTTNTAPSNVYNAGDVR